MTWRGAVAQPASNADPTSAAPKALNLLIVMREVTAERGGRVNPVVNSGLAINRQPQWPLVLRRSSKPPAA